MRLLIFAAALTVTASTALAQDPSDWRRAPLAGGSWAYRELPTGSEAVFTDARVTRRVLVKCSRATRRVTISVVSPTAASSIRVSTTEAERVLPATFDAQGFQITADLGAQDPILDAIAFSRGRVAFTIAGGSALVVPAWPEIARSIEDCRI